GAQRDLREASYADLTQRDQVVEHRIRTPLDGEKRQQLIPVGGGGEPLVDRVVRATCDLSQREARILQRRRLPPRRFVEALDEGPFKPRLEADDSGVVLEPHAFGDLLERLHPEVVDHQERAQSVGLVAGVAVREPLEHAALERVVETLRQLQPHAWPPSRPKRATARSSSKMRTSRTASEWDLASDPSAGSWDGPRIWSRQ